MARQQPERCDVELKVRELPMGRTTVEDLPSSGVMMVRGFRINGREYLVPGGSEILLKLGAGRGEISTLTVTLFPSSLRMVPEAEWDGAASG